MEDVPAVLRYVRNERLGFEVPYVHAGDEHMYRPDFIAAVDDGAGADDPVHLVLEVKGERDEKDDAKHDTMRRLWVPAVNASGRYGRWDFLIVDGPYRTADAINGYLAGRLPEAA
jgi:type III restriction enzyme